MLGTYCKKINLADSIFNKPSVLKLTPGQSQFKVNLDLVNNRVKYMYSEVSKNNNGDKQGQSTL